MKRPKHEVHQNKLKAQAMYKDGYTLRQIAQELGYKSPSWVMELVKEDQLEVKGFVQDGKIEWIK